ncbi:MAG: DUF5916 domain-containing protein [Acidobacteria bacterium]|nr:DUF5916 domain-containing protein [Acidobacteriota bacterium]
MYDAPLPYVTFASFRRAAGRAALLLPLLSPALAAGIHAQAPGEPSQAPSAVDAALAAQIDGPPAPLAPAVMSRDADGRTTVRAIRLDAGIRLDGVLDEEVYRSVQPITDFLQQVPVEGAPASERTEAWIMFDGENVYVSARVHDSAPESEWVANEMRRDTNQLRQNDTFTVFFDTFYDRRNGFNFYTNPLGARADQQFTNEGNPNSDWNPVWDVRPGRFDGGWTAEMEIPFKTLRYRSGGAQLWGVQMRRSVRRKNEWTYLTRIPISAGGGQGAAGIFRVSAGATLVGIEAPEASRLVEIKPYAIGGLATDRNSIPIRENDGSGEFGADVKLGITRNLTADLTYNTDFAQVEEDEQQVNLTRFSLFFPEKREFFLEGRGIFGFARGGVGAGSPGEPSDAPTLFYSRRIGLEGDAGAAQVVVPIHGGARMTGKAGDFDVGALSIQTQESPEAGTVSTNFTVLRIRRDILRRSSIGGIFTNRSVSLVGPGASQAYGVDGTFSLHENLDFVTYYARTRTPGNAGRDASYQGRFDYGGDRYGLTVNHIAVEENFLPEIGFLQRDNYRRSNLAGRFSPRLQGSALVRRFELEAGVDYFTTADQGLVETRERTVDFTTEFQNSDRFEVNLTNSYELLQEPFRISRDVVLPVGGYGFTAGTVSYTLGGQRRASGELAFTAGSFWSGDIRTLEYRQGRINVSNQFSVEPTISFNDIDLPEGEFTTTLVSTRFNYAFNPRMFFSGLVQYNSSTDRWSNNLRLRWEYSPGSELFVVYTEERDVGTLRPIRVDRLRNRGFVVKLNRLFRL